MIAQYYEMSDYGRSSLVRNLNTLIEERKIPEIKLYKLLAKIEQPLILVSATYDMFLENCFSEANKKYAVISSVICSRDNCRIDDTTVNLKAGQVIVRYSDQEETRVLESGQELSKLEDLKNYSLIYKIRGYCESVEQGAWQDTWTLTEENYFDFARNIGNSIPAYIVRRSSIGSCTSRVFHQVLGGPSADKSPSESHSVRLCQGYHADRGLL
jgi:hypothetical protein